MTYPEALTDGGDGGGGYAQLPRLRACLNTRLFGWPRKTSEGKYLRSSPQSGQGTTMGWKGNSLTPAGISRLHRLQVTTNCFRSRIGNPKLIRRV